jgi:hypothetical protein
VLYGLAARGPLRAPARAILRGRGKDICDLGQIGDASEAVFPIAGAAAFVRAAPRFEGTAPRTERGDFPAVNAHLMRNASVCAYSGHVLKDGRLLVPGERFRQRHRIASNGGSLGYYSERYAVRTLGPTEQLDRGIHLGGDGAFNWYHFVIECMTKAYMIRMLPDEFRGFPVIVPDEIDRIATFRDLLIALLPDRDLVAPGRRAVQVGSLIVFDEVSLGPYNMRPGLWPVFSDYAHHEAIMGAYIAELRRIFLAAGAPEPGRRRLFIVRPEVRRSYNQGQLLEIAEGFGFERFSPEKHSLKEQAQAYGEAAHIVGGSGAAWTNMIFSGRPVRGLSWLLPQYREFSSYAMLAHFLGHDLRFLTATADHPVRTTGEAYRAAQTVPPAAFEAALARLCSDE